MHLFIGKSSGNVREHVSFVNGLRGIAIIMVILHHAYRPLLEIQPFAETDIVTYFFVQPWITCGWLGVNIFFVLSGFVLFLPIVNGSEVQIAQFLFKRAWRLLPLYYLVVAVCLLIASDISLRLVGAYAFILFPSPALFFPPENPPLWSLGIEIWFSAAFPFILFAMRYIGARITLILAICLSMAVHLMGQMIYHSPGTYLNPLSDTLPGRFSDFCVGMGAAYYWRWYHRLDHYGPELLLAGSCLIALSIVASCAWSLGDLPAVTQSFSSLTLAIGVACIILAFRRDWVFPRVRALLEFKPLQVVGMMCFSLYIWHWMLMNAMSGWYGGLEWVTTSIFWAYIAALLAVSAVSYRYVEFWHVEARKLFLLGERPTTA